MLSHHQICLGLKSRYIYLAARRCLTDLAGETPVVTMKVFVCYVWQKLAVSCFFFAFVIAWRAHERIIL